MVSQVLRSDCNVIIAPTSTCTCVKVLEVHVPCGRQVVPVAAPMRRSCARGHAHNNAQAGGAQCAGGRGLGSRVSSAGTRCALPILGAAHFARALALLAPSVHSQL